MSAREWRDVPGFDGYVVSSGGAVRSRLHASGMLDSHHDIRPHKDKKGYLGMGMSDGKRIRKMRVHRIVALAFLPNPQSLPCVRHKDGNPENNDVSNLAWCSYKENEHDKKAHGTWGLRMGGAKMTPEDRSLALSLRRDGVAMGKIAKAIGVSRPTISRLVNRKTWCSL